jgi:hypothetical protein
MNKFEVNIGSEDFDKLVTSVASCINLDDLAERVDKDELLDNLYITPDDVADRMDISASDIADNIDMDELVRLLDYQKLVRVLLQTMQDKQTQ